APDPDDLSRVGPAKGGGEQYDIGGEEMVGDRNEAAAWQLLDEIGKRNVEQQHPGQCAEEQPLQIIDAARDPRLVRDRAHDVIGRQDREDIKPAPSDDLRLLWFDFYETAEQRTEACRAGRRGLVPAAVIGQAGLSGGWRRAAGFLPPC